MFERIGSRRYHRVVTESWCHAVVKRWIPWVIVMWPTFAHAEPSAEEETAASTVKLGGYFQPQFRLRENSAAPNDEDGFRFARVRPQIAADSMAGNLELHAFFEMEVQPQFSLFEAWGGVSRKLPDDGRITVDVGQMRTPISRQQLLSDANLSFVDKAQLASIAPDRDLGARVTFLPPMLDGRVKLVAGSFNGDGRNQVQNTNESFLHAARLELTPLGTAPTTIQESNLAGSYLTLAASGGYDKLTKGDHHEIEKFVGVDLTGAWMGLSGSIELLRVYHHQDGDPATRTPAFLQDGWVAQLAYLLPIELPPYGHARVEIGARVEEIDRNDTFPITVPGDPNQSVREYTAVISYYLRKHSLKVQLAASHFVELEDRTATGENASYANDQLLLQFTYRME